MTNSGWMQHPLVSRLPGWVKHALIQVRGAATAARYRRAHIGAGSYVDPSAQILGWANCRIGINSVIAEGTWIQINFPKDPSCNIAIGNHCFIGRRNFFSVGEGIVINDYVLCGPNCHFLGAGHKTDNPFLPYTAAGIENYGRIRIGVNCWLTSNVTITRGIDIGYGTIVGANSRVAASLPPLCLAYGNPAAITQLFDAQSKAWKTLPKENTDSAIAQHVASLPTEAEYLRILSTNAPQLFLSKHAAGRSAGEL